MYSKTILTTSPTLSRISPGRVKRYGGSALGRPPLTRMRIVALWARTRVLTVLSRVCLSQKESKPDIPKIHGDEDSALFGLLSCWRQTTVPVKMRRQKYPISALDSRLPTLIKTLEQPATPINDAHPGGFFIAP